MSIHTRVTGSCARAAGSVAALAAAAAQDIARLTALALRVDITALTAVAPTPAHHALMLKENDAAARLALLEVSKGLGSLIDRIPACNQFIEL